MFSPISTFGSEVSLSTNPSSCSPEQSLRWRGGTLRLENDLFTGSDRNYTNGVALTAVSRDLQGGLRPECLPQPIGLYARFIGWADPGFWHEAGAHSSSQNLVVRFGQAMYTPENKTRTDVIPDDRPYAGLLYLGLAWNRRIHPQAASYEMLDVRELTLGVIGPWSLAEQSQDLVHRARGIERFRGWNNQLRNEPAFQMAMERKFKPYTEGAVRPGWGSDVIGSYALRVGNIETAASTGVEFRAGWNIPNDFGSYPIRPGAENRPPSGVADLRTTTPQSVLAPKPGAHVFLSLEGKAVAWDFSLDGNMFRHSHHVSRRPWVAQAALGISSQWIVAGRGVRLAVMRVWRTREFDQQAGHHAFGSIALSLEF
ncbi:MULTISPECIES: lipid A deacylase LpxR family protein [Burkholderiales]|uniref:lipid A deacylase LpxR family protein n=1 Tax=Burkholderiales TaxID=80840 RepID=UPI001E50E676|nr:MULTISPECIES: lipid A deacylase LpxR family protein [Burkholderiales]MCA8225839.1 lipid A deacylase LpxR family protein [Burkholderia multivorans]WOB71589.1 lipid A deacylase LpxR family protein [Achromobacter xylosoxidans]